MKPITHLLTILLATLSFCASAEEEIKPYPLEYFALREVVNQVQLSPDGKHLALMAIPNRDGNPILEVYETADLSKKPFRMNADPMELTNYTWLGNDDILFFARRAVRDKIEGFNQGVFENTLSRLNLSTKSIKKFKDIDATVVNLLPGDPNNIIISFVETEIKAVNRFRPKSYYKFNLKTGRKSLISKGRLELGGILFDSKGNPRVARGFDVKEGEFNYFYRKAGQDDWNKIYSINENSYQVFRIAALDDTKKDGLLVIATNGKDKTGLWEFDPINKKFGELIYARSDVDIVGVQRHSNSWAHPEAITGVTYATDRRHVVYFDEGEGALETQLRKLVPFAHNLTISSRSRDGNTLVVYNSGPHDPGTFYLVESGELKKIGSKQPLIEGKNLADVKYIKYKSRDGKIIHGYLTIPHGEKPFPLVVLPHGGPFVTEVVGYDEWGQMLANNGYMVLQPEYRGSQNYGLEFYKSAFIDKAEGGYAMQDDKDDGVNYLIKQGLVDPERVAMFGWSYGGYAALVTASRNPQLYQCTIAGAAVSDPLMQVNYYRNSLRGTGLESQLKFWTKSLAPIKEVEKINIPLLIIHGSVDQRVPIKHAKKYLEELDKHHVKYKYVELEGADHFSYTLTFDHQLKLYRSIIDFLKNDCGPGGL